MNRLLLLFVLILGLLTSSQAEIPVQVKSSDTNPLTQGMIAALTAIIDRHPEYQITKDTSELHVVINVSAIATGNAVAFGATLELRPSHGLLGVATRSHIVLTDMSEGTAMIFALYEKLLIEDKMVNKLLYMRSVRVPSGDLNEVSRLMQAAKSAADRGRI